jgi:hypothetical protein
MLQSTYTLSPERPYLADSCPQALDRYRTRVHIFNPGLYGIPDSPVGPVGQRISEVFLQIMAIMVLDPLWTDPAHLVQERMAQLGCLVFLEACPIHAVSCAVFSEEVGLPRLLQPVIPRNPEDVWNFAGGPPGKSAGEFLVHDSGQISGPGIDKDIVTLEVVVTNHG